MLTGSRNKLDDLTSLDLVATVDISDQRAGERVLRLADKAQIPCRKGSKSTDFSRARSRFVSKRSSSGKSQSNQNSKANPPTDSRFIRLPEQRQCRSAWAGEPRERASESRRLKASGSPDTKRVSLLQTSRSTFPIQKSIYSSRW